MPAVLTTGILWPNGQFHCSWNIVCFFFWLISLMVNQWGIYLSSALALCHSPKLGHHLFPPSQWGHLLFAPSQWGNLLFPPSKWRHPLFRPFLSYFLCKDTFFIFLSVREVRNKCEEQDKEKKNSTTTEKLIRSLKKLLIPFFTQQVLPGLKRIVMGKWHLIQNQQRPREIFKETPIIFYHGGKSPIRTISSPQKLTGPSLMLDGSDIL